MFGKIYNFSKRVNSELIDMQMHFCKADSVLGIGCGGGKVDNLVLTDFLYISDLVIRL